MRFVKNAVYALVPAMILSLSAAAQKVRVRVENRNSATPKNCIGLLPATIDGSIDTAALAREADCKGSGDMMAKSTYVLNYFRRAFEKGGKVKEETTVFEIFMPTLKNGTWGRGIPLVTSRNGVPVSMAELEKERARAGEALEKEENKSAGAAVDEPVQTNSANTMTPLGMYSSMKSFHEKFGVNLGGAVLNVLTFLRTCELSFDRREQHEGRDTLVLSFSPGSAQLNDNEKYISQLTGLIWIDANDRIVTRLAGWPRGVAQLADKHKVSGLTEKPLAVYVEMMRLKDGIWLPRMMRINGADYPNLFEHIDHDAILTYSDYRWPRTEVKEVRD